MRSRMEKEESIYLLEYEKQKLITCAKSFEDLSQVFVYKKEEEKEDKPENREAILWKKRIVENRQLLAGNLKEMAGIMDRVAKKEVRITWYPEKKKKRMIKLLEEENIYMQDIYMLESEAEKSKVAVFLRTKKGVNYSVREVADYLSVLLNRHLQPCMSNTFYLTNEWKHFYFEDMAKYSVLTGFAKAVKETEKVSGDNYSFFESDNGTFTALLSDGMGSGEKACTDSETVIDMTEKLMDAGFSIETTVQMMNDALLAASEEKNMSTLDLCSVDLHTGSCSFIKIGSAATYLKRNREVEKIPSMSLPLGIFHQLDVTTQIRYLNNGDYIIMLSDGITDCLSEEENEKMMEQMIAEIHYEQPGEIANGIMKYILNLSKGRIRDDMTVLVMGFWENGYEEE